MRLSALAEEVIARNIEAVFIGDIQELPWVTSRIEELGFSQILNKEDDFVPNSNSDLLILDSYSLPIDNNFIQPKNWQHVVTISDSLTPQYKSSLTIFPGLELISDTENKSNILFGPEYILLRSSIQKKFYSSSKIGKLNIVVTGGGSDPFNFGGKMSEVFAKIDGDFVVTFLVSQFSTYTLDSRFKFIDIGPALDEVIQKADVVFTTASTSSLEMIAREIPIGIVCVADNQQDLYASLNRLGIVQPIGVKNINWEINIENIENLITSKELRSKLIANMSDVIDLKGCIRILEAIQNLPNQIKRA